MENHSSTLCSIVGGSSDLTKKQWTIGPPTLAPESHDPHVAGRASDISCRRSNESHGKIYFPRSRSSRTKHKRQVFFKRVANCMEKNLCYTHPLLSERSIGFDEVFACSAVASCNLYVAPLVCIDIPRASVVSHGTTSAQICFACAVRAASPVCRKLMNLR